MEIGIIWLFFAVLVGVYASKRGRSGIGWFFLACIISPLLAFLAALAVGPLKSTSSQSALPYETHVRCPDCRELVFYDARVCKHCGAKLIPLESPPVSVTTRQPAKDLKQVWQRNKGVIIVIAVVALLAVVSTTR